MNTDTWGGSWGTSWATSWFGEILDTDDAYAVYRMAHKQVGWHRHYIRRGRYKHSL